MDNLLFKDISRIMSLSRNAVPYYHYSIKGPMIETSKESADINRILQLTSINLYDSFPKIK